MSEKRTPQTEGEVIGIVSRQTLIGTRFEFDLEPGDVDPRSEKRAKEGEVFHLVLTEFRPGGFRAVPPEDEGGGPGLSIDFCLWNERFAPAVTGVYWPKGKAVAGVKVAGKSAAEIRRAGKPAVAASPLAEAEADRQLEILRDNAEPSKPAEKAKPEAAKPEKQEKPAEPQMAMVPLSAVAREVENCRRTVDEQKIGELAASIEQVGLIEPISVCQRGDTFVLIAGYRRVAAHERIGRHLIPARIWQGLSNEQIAEMQFIENLQREDLTPIEEARGIQALVKAGQSIDTVASRIDRSTEFVRGRLDLLRLAEPIQEMVASGRIPLKHGRLIARVGDEKGQMKVAFCAMGGRYWGDGVPSKAKLEEAAASDHITPLQEVRQSVTLQLQALGGARWPMDAGYAGKRPCQGCVDNSATHPGLFEQITLPGKSKKGNCSNKTCFTAKVKAWSKDPEKKRRDRERAAKAKDKGKAGAAAKGGKEQDELAAKRKAFPSTPEEKYAVAMWGYGVAVADQVMEFMKKAKKLPADALEIAVRLGLSEVGTEIWIEKSEKAQGIYKALKGKAPVTVDRSVVLEIIEGSVARGVRDAMPVWPSFRNGPDNVPLSQVDLEAIRLLEMLAKRWKVKVEAKRPTLAEFEEVKPGVVIATGKKPQALAAIAECSDAALLELLCKSSLPGDWRRAAVRRRIEALKKKPAKAGRKGVKASAAAG